MKQFQLTATIVRKIADPVFTNQIKLCEMLCPVDSLPTGIPTDPNPREPNVDRQKWQTIKQSLLNQDDVANNSFHLQNKGITIAADNAKINPGPTNNSSYINLTFKDGQGILDGGHTYRLIISSKKDIEKQKEEGNYKQHVRLYVYTGTSDDMVSVISRGLNTGYEVHEKSILNQRGSFEWIKAALSNRPDLLDEISFAENSKNRNGRVQSYDVNKDIIGFMHLFAKKHNNPPTNVYSSPSALLNKYEKNVKDYKKLYYILGDIVELYEVVRGKLPVAAETAATKKHFTLEHKRNGFVMPATGMSALYRYLKGVSLPILYACSSLIVEDDNGFYQWDSQMFPGGFSDVKDFVIRHRAKFWRIIMNYSKSNTNTDSYGKNPSYWDSLSNIISEEKLKSKIKRLENMCNLSGGTL